MQIFCNRSGRPYLKDTLGDDFRDVRANLLGPDERRQLAGVRRSGATEDLAGKVPPEKLASKMANTLSASNRLHKTYAPVQLASVRDVDAARKDGRRTLREQNPDERVTASAGKVSQHRPAKAKAIEIMLRAPGLEPAASGATGRQSP